jgi:GNAT superfamily N-acetyltransferase
MELSGTTEEPVELYVTASGSAADAHHPDVLIHLQFLNPSTSVWLDVYAEPHVSGETLTGVMADAIDLCRSAIGSGDWVVKTGCYGGDERAAMFYRAAGFSFERRFLRMVIDFDGVRPDPGPLPSGVILRSVDVDDLAGQEVVHSLFEDAFGDHWDHHERTFENWYEHMQTMRDADGTRRSWLLYVGDDPAAVAIVDDSRAELGYGFIGILGVRREFRVCGLGTWLLRCGFADAYDRGRQGVMLTVDSESETGADRLYRSVGMHSSTELHAWRRPLFD